MASKSWSHLPAELFEIIAKLLVEDPIDLLQCRDVCPSWRYVVNNLFRDEQFQSQLFPTLFVSLGQIKDLEGQGLFNPFTRNYKECKIPRLDQAHNGSVTKFTASSCGWLLLISSVTSSVHDDDNIVSASCSFFNPLLNVQVDLPTLRFRVDLVSNVDEVEPKSCNSGDTNRFTVSTKPFEALALINQKALVFWRRGDKQWNITYLESKFSDVVHHKGDFYAIDEYFNLMLIKLCVPNPSINIVIRWSDRAMSMCVVSCQYKRWFLVESFSGDLLFVFGEISQNRDGSKVLGVCKMNSSKDQWIQRASLGDDSVFVGKNDQAICVPIGNSTLYKKGFIYFRFHKENCGRRQRKIRRL